MALEGRITWTNIYYSDDELVDQVVTYPEEMDENDINYHKAGTTETIQEPKQIMTSATYDYVYLWVKQIDVIYNFVGEHKNEGIHYHIAAYNSKEERNADQENFLFHHVRELQPVDKDQNLWQQCYDDLKKEETFENLTDI